ncbi:SulP family inorganic anion transporter [Pseudomonas sp. TNT2022 ID609]|uniref:SulP family inorganic anion transporter n=1 Tax=Pseudomonas rubra TaxID=2942627 RepID=UPI0023606548|nr:SulP family inorganic anion transporter [Pseudomonas rubra]MDD1041371.1 SulP family inorganic anion transporter [Pseudomonas rubra]
MRTPPLRADVLAGLTTAFALVPECIAFALVAHLNPLMGLYGAFIICTLTALFGGRPGMISGAAGSMAVVIVALVVSHGVQYLLATVLLGGLIMIAFGLLRLGKLVRMVPYSVMLGFVNGLAIIIALAQFEHFKADGAWLSGAPLGLMLGLVALTMAIVYLLPRLTRSVPPALVAILGVGAGVYLLDLPTRTLGDLAHIAGGLPALSWPQVPWNLETLKVIAPYALLMALVGLLETLLTLNLTDEITETRGHPNRECVALGVANMTSGLFGGILGGCAMIGQTVFTDLATAVLCGIVIAALNFAWQQARELYADSHTESDGSKLYQVHGTLFFASTTPFLNQFDPANDPDKVTLDCRHLNVVDYSAIAALKTLRERYSNNGKHLHVVHLSARCKQLLKRAGQAH